MLSNCITTPEIKHFMHKQLNMQLQHEYAAYHFWTRKCEVTLPEFISRLCHQQMHEGSAAKLLQNPPILNWGCFALPANMG